MEFLVFLVGKVDLLPVFPMEVRDDRPIAETSVYTRIIILYGGQIPSGVELLNLVISPIGYQLPPVEKTFSINS